MKRIFVFLCAGIFIFSSVVRAEAFFSIFNSKIDLVKKGTLPIDESLSLEKLFNSYKYFKNVKWESFEDDRGRDVIQVSATLDTSNIDFEDVFSYISRPYRGGRDEELGREWFMQQLSDKDSLINNVKIITQFRLTDEGFYIGYFGYTYGESDFKASTDWLQRIYTNKILIFPFEAAVDDSIKTYVIPTRKKEHEVWLEKEKKKKDEEERIRKDKYNKAYSQFLSNIDKMKTNYWGYRRTSYVMDGYDIHYLFQVIIKDIGENTITTDLSVFLIKTGFQKNTHVFDRRDTKNVSIQLNVNGAKFDNQYIHIPISISNIEKGKFEDAFSNYINHSELIYDTNENIIFFGQYPSRCILESGYMIEENSKKSLMDNDDITSIKHWLRNNIANIDVEKLKLDAEKIECESQKKFNKNFQGVFIGKQEGDLCYSIVNTGRFEGELFILDDDCSKEDFKGAPVNSVVFGTIEERSIWNKINNQCMRLNIPTKVSIGR